MAVSLQASFGKVGQDIKGQVQTTISDVKKEVKQQINKISKEAVSEVEKYVDVDLGGIKTSDLEKIVNSLKKGDFTAATSWALDATIIAATSGLGGIGALFGAAVVGVKHLFEALVNEPTKEQKTKADLEQIIGRILLPNLRNIPTTVSQLNGYRKAYKLNFPIVDTENWLYGFLRNEFYESILKQKGAIPGRVGIYPKYTKIRYSESWKQYQDIIRTLFYKLFPYSYNRLLYPSEKSIKLIKDGKMGIPYNDIWFWDAYWQGKDSGFKDRVALEVYDEFDNPPPSLKKTPEYPQISPSDIIYSSETGLPVEKKTPSRVPTVKDTLFSTTKDKKKSPRLSKDKKKTPRLSKDSSDKDKVTDKIKDKGTILSVIDIFWAALGLPYA